MLCDVSACMGTEQQPEHREGLALIQYLRERYDRSLEETEELPPQDDWDDR